MGEPPVLPSINLAVPFKIKTVEIPLPTADIPSHQLLIVPPSNLKEPEGVKPEATEETPTGIRQVDIPFTNFKMPVPENEILITAGTTAVVSVAATLTATAAFKWVVTVLKPILKTAWKKIKLSKGNPKVS
tara:strand:+ start:140 stop:532 length:393 start_codon:yes stop_codon:yes gene_type:complete